MSRFRVLSLDGGGVNGAFTASILANFEQLTGKSIVDHFDLVTGTSTGGLIALGLGLGIPAENLLRFYTERGPRIFAKDRSQRFFNRLRHPFRPKYSHEEFESAITEIFEEHRLGDSYCRIVVPSFDCNAGRVQLFKTAHHERFVQDYRLTAREVAMATAAAPTYFPAFSAHDGQAYLDGGIWANCPIVIGLLEAVFVLGKLPANVDILSIGTTESPFDVSSNRRLGGWLTWNRKLVTLLMQAQIDGALAQAQLITGTRALRIDATTRPGWFRLDDSRRIDELSGLGTHHAKRHLDEVRTRFLDSPVEAFVPFHSTSTLEATPATPAPEPRQRRRRRRSLGQAQVGFHRAGFPIANISCSGALIETDGELPVGNPIELRIQLEDGSEAHVEGIVVRIQHPSWGVTGGVGVHFTFFHDDAHSTIARYVDDEATTSSEFDTDETTVLN